jgi:hypothetical protein
LRNSDLQTLAAGPEIEGSGWVWVHDLYVYLLKDDDMPGIAGTTTIQVAGRIGLKSRL